MVSEQNFIKSRTRNSEIQSPSPHLLKIKTDMHYENMSLKYTENFTTKKWKFSDKKILVVFMFLLKSYIVGTC